MYQKLCAVLFAFIVFCANAQQPKDTLAQLYKPYQSAMGILLQSERALLQDSAVFEKEWQRLDMRLKHLSDSIATNNTTKAPIYMEYQSLIDRVTYNPYKDSLQPRLNALYAYTVKHQDALVENGPQFNKTAQCLLGVRKENTFTESAIIAYNAALIRDLHKQLNTTGWDAKKHQDFFSFFAAQYANTSNIGMAEQLYRQFDDVLVVEGQPMPSIDQLHIPDSLNFVNGNLINNTKTWKDLKKDKIVIQPQEQSLFDLVYVVRTLWAWDKAYKNDYTIIVLRDKDIITDAFLVAAKRNLAFANYYIASYTPQDSTWVQQLPRYAMLNTQDKVKFATQDPITFYKHLNAPIVAQQAHYDQQYKEAHEKREAAKAKDLALPLDTSEKYKTTHQKINFSLLGHWPDSLSTKLTPVRWSQTDTLSKMKLPYLGQLQVNSKGHPVNQQFVLVNGKKQDINMLADRAFKISVNYKRNKNAQWHEALRTIDSTLMLQSNYEFILKQYPFQKSKFINQLKTNKELTITARQEAIEAVRNKKTREVLERYAEEKRKLIEQGGLM